jgi:small subunit ribosomal protein S20
MARTASAKKAERVSKRRHLFNVRLKRDMKSEVKEITKLIDAKSKEAIAALSKVQQAIDKAAKHGTIKKNTAARMKSRIAKRLAALAK